MVMKLAVNTLFVEVSTLKASRICPADLILARDFHHHERS